jgi:hypothetical protein
MNSRGIVYIVLGEGFDTIASHAMALSRRFIPVSISVITNIKNRNKKWDESSDINFIYLDVPINKNRELKTLIYKYTPYDETLYLDADAVIVKNGIEKIFDHFSGNDLILQANAMSCWKEDDRYFKLYRDTVKKLGCSLPINIFQGAIFAFKKNSATQTFFDKWNEYWKITGSGRDMPAFCCAVQSTKISYSLVTLKEHKFFIFGNKPDFICVHPITLEQLNKQFGIPLCKVYKDFDIGKKDDWKLVYFDDREDIFNNEWIKKKFNREMRIITKSKYISDYLPEIKRGNLDILDMATGPGEFLELCMARLNRVTGIEYCEGITGIENNFLVQKFNVLKHKEKKLPIIYADCNKVICGEILGFERKKYDIINCQLAINLIFHDIFDHHRERGAYHNDGDWIFGEKFDEYFKKYFKWCMDHLKPNGIIMIAALHAKNEVQYSYRISAIAKEIGLKLEMSTKNLNHKFRLV